MKLTSYELLCNGGRTAMRMLLVLMLMTGVLWFAPMKRADAAVSTTTVQGTVYLANGQPGSGMLHVSWPAFTSANGQSIVADSTDVTIGEDGFLNVNLAPNQGAMPGGLYYTATFYMSDGSVSTQYWVIPAAAQVTLAQVQAQVMPAAQAVQAVNKAYVDQAIAQVSQSVLTGSGGSLTGPLYLSGDPSQPLQAADKHYVDLAVSQVGTGSVNPATPGQVAVYADNGTSLVGTSTVPVTAGGTGSVTAAGALQNLGGISATAASTQAMAGSLDLQGNVKAAQTINGSGPEYNALFYGADPAGASDSTAAIQAAIDAAYAHGGGIVYLPGGHYRHTGITLWTGTRLIGDAHTWNPSGAAGTDGTVLVNTGSGPNITVTPTHGAIANDGYTFEIGWLELIGSTPSGSGLDDGIDLMANTGTTPRAGYIHDLSIDRIGQDALRIYGTSYNHFERVFIGGTNCGGSAINIPGFAGGITEFTWFKDIAIDKCGGPDIHISAGFQMYFNNIDTGTREANGLLIDGGQNYYFDGLSFTAPSVTAIEFNTPSAGMGSFHFTNTAIYMAGNSVGEKAIWAHGAGVLFDTEFTQTNVYRFGATAPTNYIVDTVSAALGSGNGIAFSNLQNGSGSSATINSAPAFQLPLNTMTTFWNGQFWNQNPNDADIDTENIDGQTGLRFHYQSSGSNFYATQLHFTGTQCSGGPGMIFAGSTAPAARNAESLLSAFCFANNGNFYANGQSHYFIYSHDGPLAFNLQAGTTADQDESINFRNYTGSTVWAFHKIGGPNYLFLSDAVNNIAREAWIPNGQTIHNAGAGANDVEFGASPGAGTGGIAVWSGGASPIKVAAIDGSGNYKNGGGTTVLPSTLSGFHGASGTKVQLSDGTGTTGGLALYAADGSVTAGPMPPAGAMVGTNDTQTLTNKSIAGTEVNSGTVGVAYGGTGQNESTATGIGQWNSGSYSVSTALANGTTATTQSGGDNSTKVATTSYVASPGAITPTTVTASGMVTGGNDTTRITAAAIGTTGFSSTGLVLPTVPANTTKNGRCVVLWQMSSTSYTATFGLGMSNAPTGLWGGSSVMYAAAGTSNWLAFSQTATAATAVSTAVTAGAANTTYRAEIDFTVQTGSTNPVAVTLYALVSQSSATLTIQPGSACYWLP